MVTLSFCLCLYVDSDVLKIDFEVCLAALLNAFTAADWANEVVQVITCVLMLLFFCCFCSVHKCFMCCVMFFDCVCVCVCVFKDIRISEESPNQALDGQSGFEPLFSLRKRALFSFVSS